MQSYKRSRLSLVQEPAGVGLTAIQTAHTLESTSRIAELLQEDRIPFCIRLTLEQMLVVAEDADVRAQMLEWSVDGVPDGDEILRRAISLRKVAMDLKRIASALKIGWSEPSEPPGPRRPSSEDP